MNVWLTRALRTAVFTGGLLAVGAGIASADDDVLDVTAPVTVTDNAVAILGTAPGSTPPEIVLPAVSGTVAADLGPVAVSAPVTVGGNAADVAGIDLAQPAAPAGPGGGGAPAVEVDVPVVVCGNAVAGLGGAEAGCTPPDGGNGDGGNGDGGTGANGTVLGADVPVLACGNGVGVLGRAAAGCGAPGGAPGEPGTSGGQPAPGGGGAEGTQQVAASAADDVPGWAADHGQADGMPAGALAWTGFPVTLPLLGGLLAVALGAGLRLLGRYRRPALG